VSTRQYNRKLSLIVGGASSQTVTDTPQGRTTTFNDVSDALDLSSLRVVFSIRRGDKQVPNSADVRIYNVKDETANRLTKEFTRVVIQAGYEGNFGLLFDGTIKQARRGRLDAKDDYVDIVAADGDQAYNYSVMSLSLAAGSQPPDDLRAFIASMARFGITQGYTPELSQNGRVRGRVFYGMTRDELREWAEVQDALWSIQNGQLTLIPKTSYVPGETPLISPTTGLIGVPEQTANGIEMRVLLNPSIKIGQRVKLDSTVNPFRFGLDLESQGPNFALERSIKTNADGLYYVMSADHTGDTRGNAWYTDLVCLAVDATVPLDAVRKAAILPEAASIRRY
jgi:hypothetical protein